MPDNNGIYTLVPGYLAQAGQTIKVSQHNPVLEDIADAFNRRLMRDGTTPMTGDLPMGGNKITGLSDPSAAQDGATKAYVDGEVTGLSNSLGTAATVDHGTDPGEVPLNSDLTDAEVPMAGKATTLEAQAGTDNTKWMTPARTFDAVRELAWKRVAKVATGTGAAVTITGLDLTKETMFVVSYVKNADTAARTFLMRASEDGGASWGPVWGSLSASANWSAGTLRGAVELIPDSANGSVIASSLLSGALGADARQFPPVEVVTGGSPVLTPACDTVEFYWTAGNFAASGAPVGEADCIIVYQRG